jgi:hypothetical protein
MPIVLNGDSGITTPGLTNTGSTTLVSLTTTGNTILGDTSTDTLNVANGNLVLNSSGNLGLGVTPSAWGSDYKALQIGGSATAALSYKNFVTSLSINVYSTNANDVALENGLAAKYELNGSGQHVWKTASVSAGSNITFTQAMTLDSSGNLGVGTVTIGGRITTNGTASILPLVITNSSTSGYSGIHFLSTAGVVQGHMGFGNSAVAAPLTSAMYIGSIASIPLLFTTADAERMRITSGGNVGIGENAPASTLVVRKDANAAVGGEMTILNYGTSAIGNAAQLNFGLESSSYSGDNANAQIKGIVTAVNNSSDLVYSLYNGTNFAERFRMAATGVFTSTGTSMAVVGSNAVAITVNTTTPTTIASVTITTKGKPVFIMGCGDMNPDVAGNWNYFVIYRNGGAVSKIYIGQTAFGSYNLPFSICMIDSPGAGSHTYDLRAYQGVGVITYGETGNSQAPTLVAIEVM